MHNFVGGRESFFKREQRSVEEYSQKDFKFTYDYIGYYCKQMGFAITYLQELIKNISERFLAQNILFLPSELAADLERTRVWHGKPDNKQPLYPQKNVQTEFTTPLLLGWIPRK